MNRNSLINRIFAFLQAIRILFTKIMLYSWNTNHSSTTLNKPLQGMAPPACLSCALILELSRELSLSRILSLKPSL